MQINNDTSKPCLVEARQGLSVLYQNRFLYSKYNPAANIERLVNSLEIKKDTLILCFSPILGYGLESLQKKIPSGCFMLAVEANPHLVELYNIKALPTDIGFLGPDRLKNIYNILTKKNQITDNGIRIPPPGSFKYCLRLDFSGAPALNQEEYQTIQHRAELAVSNFWKNRLTLVKMGRLYHRNIIRNLALVPSSYDVPAKQIDAPLLVLGAGPSADKTIEKLAALSQDFRKKLVVLAVDAVVPALLARKIKPDFVLALECQYAIQQAYATAHNSNLFLLADLTSRPSILHQDTSYPSTDKQRISAANSKNHSSGKNCTGGKTAFFSTEFASTRFFERLFQHNFIQQSLPPLGSVGITAMEMALLLRKDEIVPVYVSGLDFSFSMERSHCKESFQTKNSFLKTNRLHSLGSYHCLQNTTTEKYQGKAGVVYSDQILSYYCRIFCDRFQYTTNAYDVGEMGLDLGIKRKSFVQVLDEITSMNKTDFDLDEVLQKNIHQTTFEEKNKRVLNFYSQEESMLKELREGLSTGNITKERILGILEETDYLYLHFPDGYKATLDISFLKRVRSEIDFFLKDIEIGKSMLNQIHR